MNKTIVVIGASHHNTLSVIRSIGLFGWKTDVILHDGTCGSFVLKSKYVQSGCVARNESEALKILEKQYDEAIVIACSDRISLLMDQHYNRLKTRYVFFNCNQQGALSLLQNKAVQVSLAKKAGFVVPLSVASDVFNDASWTNYPCIVKPLNSAHGGKSLIVCENEESLRLVLDEHKLPNRLLVQNFIKINKEFVVLGLSIPHNIYISGVVEKHRELVGSTTYSTVRDSNFLPNNVIEACKRLVRDTNYEGLFGIECAYDGANFQFIEINFRNDATTYSLCKAGRNLIEAYCRYVWQDDVWQELLNVPIQEVCSMVEFRDITNVINHKVGLLKWLYQFNRAGCLYFWDKDDMKPFYSELSKLLVHIIRKYIIKKLCH